MVVFAFVLGDENLKQMEGGRFWGQGRVQRCTRYVIAEGVSGRVQLPVLRASSVGEEHVELHVYDEVEERAEEPGCAC